MAFKCSKCGACCRRLDGAPGLLDALQGSTGSCVFFDKKTNLCKIYEQRFLECRVDENFRKKVFGITEEQYYELTEKLCQLNRQAAEECMPTEELIRKNTEILIQYPVATY